MTRNKNPPREETYQILVLAILHIEDEILEVIRKTWAYGISLCRIAYADTVGRGIVLSILPQRDEQVMAHICVM